MSLPQKSIPFTKEEFLQAINNAKSISGTMKNLGKCIYGRHPYRLFHRCKELWNIDTSHFTGQGWNKSGRVFNPKARDIKEYLVVNGPHIISSRLSKRLRKANLKPNYCEKCQLSSWNSLPIPLELHHINGNSDDNRIENLLILCRNCHGQTLSFSKRKS